MTCTRCRGLGYHYDRGFPTRCKCEVRVDHAPRDVKEWERMIRESANLFKVVRKIGPGRFDRWEFETEEEARRFARGRFGDDKRSMIYGVTPEGRSVMLGNQ